MFWNLRQLCNLSICNPCDIPNNYKHKLFPNKDYYYIFHIHIDKLQYGQ